MAIDVNNIDPKVLERAQKMEEKKAEQLEKSKEALAEKYPHADIDTLRFDSAANKNVVTISCVECGAERDVYTSDLWQVNRCAECTAKAKAEARKAKAAELKEAREYLKQKRESGE